MFACKSFFHKVQVRQLTRGNPALCKLLSTSPAANGALSTAVAADTAAFEALAAIAEERFEMITYRQDPSVAKFATDLMSKGWPKWFAHARQPYVTQVYHGWYPGPMNFEAFPDFSFVVRERATGIFCATTHLMPLYIDFPLTELPDQGYDWCLSTAVTQQRRRDRGEYLPPPNTCTGESMNVHPDFRGRDVGISNFLIKKAVEVIRGQGIKDFILPVRPNVKVKYQDMDIREFFQMRDKEGRHVDYWTQQHIDAGMRLLKPAPYSMTMVGTVAQWEEWLGQKLPRSGKYNFTDKKYTMLAPLWVDLEKDSCTYVEPNMWGTYRIE